MEPKYQREQPERVISDVAEARAGRGQVGKVIKMIVFSALLVAAGYYFGLICGQVGRAYEMLFSPSRDTLYLVGQLLLAMGVLAVTSGLVAVLFRPFWTCLVAFVFSSAAVLVAWEIGLGSGIAVLVYLVASLLYTRGVIAELNNRVHFSVRPVAQSQRILLMALVAVACASLYLGYAAQIEREGFSLPPSARDVITRMTMMPIERRIEEQAGLTPAEKAKVLAGVRAELESQWLGPMEETLKRYELYIPIGVAAMLLMSLTSIVSLLSWLPPLILSVVFLLLTTLRVTRVVTETREVKRLTLG
ncbi:MAG: hypothetical protein ISS49_08220 [Anaerolineae bacterium]|nr:hypothetical protein [Anaerolineae bacterium]